ncbi:hypothetical protein D3C72_1678140 [compost metagenome]
MLHGGDVGTEQLEYLQRREIGRAFGDDRCTRIDEQLGGQVQRLLRAGQHQHLRRVALQADTGRFTGDLLAQLRFAFAGAVLRQCWRYALEIQCRQAIRGRQAAGKRDHFRALCRSQDLADQ